MASFPTLIMGLRCPFCTSNCHCSAHSRNLILQKKKRKTKSEKLFLERGSVGGREFRERVAVTRKRTHTSRTDNFSFLTFPTPTHPPSSLSLFPTLSHSIPFSFFSFCLRKFSLSTCGLCVSASSAFTTMV